MWEKSGLDYIILCVKFFFKSCSYSFQSKKCNKNMEQTSILTRFIFILFHVFRNNNMNGQTTPDEDIVKHICMYNCR